MSAPAAILDLVDRFGRSLSAYHRPEYKEAELRNEFLDPFFAALGWDMTNAKGAPEAYKEVVHEPALKGPDRIQAPDYCFRTGGNRRFFVEAKKPSVNIKDDPAPAFQLRRYAWTAKLPVSVLTDFEEFAIYDCRFKPASTDAATKARIQYFRYTDYAERWDEIASVFSKDAVVDGRFAAFAERTKSKRGTEEVDEAFLGEIESWREQLAKALAETNSEIDQRELNFAVQQIIDRIIFLRICEDREIEPYGRLRSLLSTSKAYEKLRQMFRQADARYNSGLFYFKSEKNRAEQPDRLTLGLTLENKPLHDIINRLYYPESPYAFRVLSADILGQIYERFLGKIIRLTSGHRAKVDDKPEVKKAGGVYYTPSYIVEYLVRQTVGSLCAGRSPTEIKNLRIVDPACGSGSFLIATYQYLLDWYLSWYSTNKPKSWAKGTDARIYESAGGWRLTSRERKRILLDHIFGVDIDPQAVEVTKLSLVLKVLEGETSETVTNQLELLRERALPDLGRNILCGNSLIDFDVHEGEQLGFDRLTEAERYRVNMFDWKSAFPSVFSRPNPGFDAAIGNPPYLSIQTLQEWAPFEADYYKTRYKTARKGNYDIYVVFLERTLELLRNHGRLGFILPHRFFSAQYGEPVRELISLGRHVSEIVHFGDQQVFAGASTYTCLLALDRNARESFEFKKVTDISTWQSAGAAETATFSASALSASEWHFALGPSANIIKRLKEMNTCLRDVAERMYQGPITSADTVFLFKQYRGSKKKTVEVFSEELEEWVELERSILKPVVRSGDIERFTATPNALVLFPYAVQDVTAKLYSPKQMDAQFPCAWKYLQRHKKKLEGREKGAFKDEAWYRFGRTQNLGMWEQSKLMVPYMVPRLAAYFDEADHYYFINVTTGGYGITCDAKVIDLPYLCALLNSRLLDFYFKHISTPFRGGYFAANKQYIEQLPIRMIDPKSADDRRRHGQLVQATRNAHELRKRLVGATTPQEQSLLRGQIAATDRQIDRAVYDLYGLTDAEIRVVEESGAAGASKVVT